MIGGRGGVGARGLGWLGLGWGDRDRSSYLGGWLAGGVGKRGLRLMREGVQGLHGHEVQPARVAANDRHLSGVHQCCHDVLTDAKIASCLGL